MVNKASPLRYPGGKSCLFDLVSLILRTNKLDRGHYVEPFAGGCGLALGLLFEGVVSDIHINDIDNGIWSFWHSVLNQTDDFIELINSTSVTMETWKAQQSIYKNDNKGESLALGFATFFLNRTNRSGVIKGAGVIGGNAQLGNYKIDCRFNKTDLIKRIRRIAKYRGQIHLSQKDALKFLKSCEATLPINTFYCIDPPYFEKGSALYTNFYQKSDHEKLSKVVKELTKPWIVTYDHVPEIEKLYKQRQQFSFDVNYSLQTKRIGTELLIASKGLKFPKEIQEKTMASLAA